MADRVKRNQFTLLFEKKKYVCQSLKLLKLESESKFTST